MDAQTATTKGEEKAMRYRITSKAGQDMGTYKGETDAHALAAMHRDAGYDVTAGDGELIFADPDDREVCGEVADWHVDALDALPGG